MNLRERLRNIDRVERGQRGRPFWKRAGIWWLHALIGGLWLAVGIANLVAGDTGFGVLGVTAGAVSVLLVYPAYRQNRQDREAWSWWTRG